jgi:hypothetical protein
MFVFLNLQVKPAVFFLCASNKIYSLLSKPITTEQCFLNFIPAEPFSSVKKTPESPDL